MRWGMMIMIVRASLMQCTVHVITAIQVLLTLRCSEHNARASPPGPTQSLQRPLLCPCALEALRSRGGVCVFVVGGGGAKEVVGAVVVAEEDVEEEDAEGPFPLMVALQSPGWPSPCHSYDGQHDGVFNEWSFDGGGKRCA